MKLTPTQEAAELTKLFRQLRENVAALPAEPSRELVTIVHRYADQAALLAQRVRELVETQPPPPLSAAELDALEGALGEAMIELHERFGRYLTPRVS